MVTFQKQIEFIRGWGNARYKLYICVLSYLKGHMSIERLFYKIVEASIVVNDPFFDYFTFNEILLDFLKSIKDSDDHKSIMISDKKGIEINIFKLFDNQFFNWVDAVLEADKESRLFKDVTSKIQADILLKEQDLQKLRNKYASLS